MMWYNINTTGNIGGVHMNNAAISILKEILNTLEIESINEEDIERLIDNMKKQEPILN